MKKKNAFLGMIIAIMCLSCSSNSDEPVGLVDSIVGIWKQVRTVDILNGQMIIVNADDCGIQSSQTFNADQTYSYRFFDNEFTPCQLAEESVSGTWIKDGNFYNISFRFRDVTTGEEFDGDANIEYDARDIFIENDTLKIRFTFPDEVTIVEYTK